MSMIDFLENLHPVMQAFLATIFTWGLTALGAASVFISRGMSRKILDGMLGFAAGVIGAAAVILAQPILPYALSSAAGAMFFVVVEELIPESQRGGHTDLATMGAMIGFWVMMVLDVALG